MKQLLAYLKAWVNGDDAELHIDKTWHFGWWELIPILIIVGLLIYLICG